MENLVRPRDTYVDMKKVLKSLDTDKAVDLLEFHLHLNQKNLWEGTSIRFLYIL